MLLVSGMAKDSPEPTELPELFIRERMLSPRVTGDELAERMGTTPATISRLLNGRRKMTLEWLYAFSKALNAPIADLFSPPSEDSEAKLRSVLTSMGVDNNDLGRAVSSVKVFLDGPGELRSPDPQRDQSEPASRPREAGPARTRAARSSS